MSDVEDIRKQLAAAQKALDSCLAQAKRFEEAQGRIGNPQGAGSYRGPRSAADCDYYVQQVVELRRSLRSAINPFSHDVGSAVTTGHGGTSFSTPHDESADEPLVLPTTPLSASPVPVPTVVSTPSTEAIPAAGSSSSQPPKQQPPVTEGPKEGYDSTEPTDADAYGEGRMEGDGENDLDGVWHDYPEHDNVEGKWDENGQWQYYPDHKPDWKKENDKAIEEAPQKYEPTPEPGPNWRKLLTPDGRLLADDEKKPPDVG